MVEVVKIGAPFLGKIVDYLVDPIKRQFTYMCCFNSNITELETKLKDLEITKQGVQMGVDENRRKVIGPNVEAWLTSANEVTTEIEGIIQDKAKVKEWCLYGWCPNIKLRYSLSRKAVKKTKVVVDLKADGVQYTQSSYCPPPACLNFKGILSLPSSLRNLHTLSLSDFNGKVDNVSEFGGLFNLKTLSFCDSRMKELPEAIGELINLRLLDLTDTKLERIPPGVISRLVRLEELYLGGFVDWEGEGKEEKGRNANLRELELLSNLNTLEIVIRSDVLIPKVPIFSKLKIYKVVITDEIDRDGDISGGELEDEEENLFVKCKRWLLVRSSIPIPSNRGGIDSLLRSSDVLFLSGKGCNDLVQALLLRNGVDGLQQLKLLINQNVSPIQ